MGIKINQLPQAANAAPTDVLPVDQSDNVTRKVSALQLGSIDPHADMVDGMGRNLLSVLGVSSIPAAMDALSLRCNGTGTPNFSDLMIGDYIDGLDLSSIPAENGGDAGQMWSNSYRNNRIILSGFNTYKGFGYPNGTTKNHLLFTFRNIPIRKRINATNNNTGGYIASELRAFLEGVNGDGTGDKTGVTTAAFMNALNTQFGAGHLLSIRKAHSIKSSSAWATYTVFIPSELEIIGYPTFGDEGVYMSAITSPAIASRADINTNVNFPIFSISGVYRIKLYNGSRLWYFTQTPLAANSVSNFVIIHNFGNSITTSALDVGGVSPAFCVV